MTSLYTVHPRKRAPKGSLARHLLTPDLDRSSKSYTSVILPANGAEGFFDAPMMQLTAAIKATITPYAPELHKELSHFTLL